MDPRETIRESADSRAQQDSPPSFRGTILVGEDEPTIRAIIRLTLVPLGFELLEASDGKTVLELFEQHRSRIDLVVLDLCLPTLSGHEVLEHLLRESPQPNILVTSGYSTEYLSEAERTSIIGFLEKPFAPADLVDLVESTLERRKTEKSTKAG